VITECLFFFDHHVRRQSICSKQDAFPSAVPETFLPNTGPATFTISPALPSSTDDPDAFVVP